MSLPLLPPGATIGILGAGQLARMLSHAANRLGYRVIAWSGGGDSSPVQGVCAEVFDAPFSDSQAQEEFASKVDRVTAEIENLPPALLTFFESQALLAPKAGALRITGNRRLEREFAASHKLPQTEFRLLDESQERLQALTQSWQKLGEDAVAKTTMGGYDGRGQWRLRNTQDLAQCAQESTGHKLIIERFIPFEREVSCLVARNGLGEIRCYDPVENDHRSHVLSRTLAPARVSATIATQAQEIATQVIEGLDYQGLLAVEFFLTQDQHLLINEIAPRPHNSGHHTLDACHTSQFDQHIRAVCGLPLGSTAMRSAAVMINLLSDQWPGDARAAQRGLFDFPQTSLHLYAKSWKAGRRKLGHANFTGKTLDEAIAQAQPFEEALRITQSQLSQEDA